MVIGSSKLVELFEGIVDNNYSSIGTLPGDSGACVTTKEGAIHSFVIGKTSGADQFRLLSPAHFVLEQIKTLIDKENVKFVKCDNGDVNLLHKLLMLLLTLMFMSHAPVTTTSNVNPYDDDNNVATTYIANATDGFIYDSCNDAI